MTNTEANDKAATAADQSAHVAPEKGPSKRVARKTKAAAKTKKGAKAAEPKKPGKAQRARAQKSATERSNKKAEIIAMMKRAKGATLAEIMEMTGWQAHTVRGFVSILGSKGGEKVESAKNAAGERSYHIAK
jgi:Protein of unknown function (DUF3489)